MKGSEQIGFTILSLTVSLIAVLIPLLFMGDIVGRLFREFAVTLAVTILVSAVVSLTLTPMMCARLLKHTPGGRARVASIAQTGRMFDATIEYYGTTLQWVLRHQEATLLVAVGTLVLTILLYIVVPKGFFPVQDTGRDSGSVGSAAHGVVSRDGAATAGAGAGDSEGPRGREPVVVRRDRRDQHHRQQRTLPDQPQTAGAAQSRASATVIDRLQPQLARVQGITLFLQPVQDLTVEDRVSRTQYQYSLEDPNVDELNTWTAKLVAKLRTLPELRDVATDQQNSGSQVQLVIDRNTASRLGITPQMIDDTLYDAFGQRQVSDDVHAVEPVSRGAGSRSRIPEQPALVAGYLSLFADGGSVPLSTLRAASSRARFR